MRAPTGFEKKHYEKLLGFRVAAIEWEDVDGSPAPVLILQDAGSTRRMGRAVILCDPEGNGPGHIQHDL